MNILNIIRNIFVVVFLTSLIAVNVNAELNCNIRELSSTNNRFTCTYYPIYEEAVIVKLNPDKDLMVYTYNSSFITKPGTARNIDIFVDINKSTYGNHKLNIQLINRINIEEKTINIFINKEELIIKHELIYKQGFATFQIYLQNNEPKRLNYIIQSTQLPNGFVKPNNTYGYLESFENKVLDIPLAYNNPDTNKVGFEIITNKTYYVEDTFYKQKVPVNNSSGLFILSNIKSDLVLIIILDLILFIIAVILFVMFISRFGKILVKQN